MRSSQSLRIASVIFKLPVMLLVLFVVNGLSSCIVVPIPQDHVNGRAVSADPLTIKVAVTTQEDVLLRLGDPDAIWVDQRVFAYTWDHVTMAVVVVIVTYTSDYVGGGDTNASHEVLLVQFDKKGLVQRVNQTSRPQNVPWEEFLKKWVDEGTRAKP